MFYESLIAQEMVHVLEHVENDVSSTFKLTFHWYDVYRNRLHQLSDNNKNISVVAVLRACLSVCMPTVTGMPAVAMLNLDLLC